MKIEKIYIYPVKSLQAVEISEAQVSKHGFYHDRRFMLMHLDTDADGTTVYRNVHLPDYPQSVLIRPSIDTANGKITVTYKPTSSHERSLAFPPTPAIHDLEVVDVIMHESPTKAYKMHQLYSDWFSSCLGIAIVLVYLGPHYRAVRMSSIPNRPRYPSPPTQTTAGGWLSSITSIPSMAASYIWGTPTAPEDEKILTFTDCAPFLIASSKSMEDVLSRLPAGEPVDMVKFRPNIVVSGAAEAWEEDYWSQITINGTTQIDCLHNCGRCKSINIDYTTGGYEKTPAGEILKRLQRDRRVDPGIKYSPVFGRYAFLHKDSEGHMIHVGDEVEVTRRNAERTVFGKFCFL